MERYMQPKRCDRRYALFDPCVHGCAARPLALFRSVPGPRSRAFVSGFGLVPESTLLFCPLHRAKGPNRGPCHSLRTRP